MQRRVVLGLQGLLDVEGTQRLRKRPWMAGLGRWKGWRVLLQSTIDENWLPDHGTNGPANHRTYGHSDHATNGRADGQAIGQADCRTDNQTGYP